MMKIVTVIFGTRFDRYLRALEASIGANAPGCDFEVVEGSERQRVNGLPPWAPDNNYKLRLWAEAVAECDDDLLLLDADTLVLNDPQRAFREHRFDVAYTVRPALKATRWLNAGAVYVRPNDRSRQFFLRWVAKDTELLTNPKRFLQEQHNHIGQNQASLAAVVSEPPVCNLRRLPCEIYNCVDETWATLDETQTVVLHVKGQLRQLLDEGATEHAFPREMKQARTIFLKYEAIAKCQS